MDTQEMLINCYCHPVFPQTPFAPTVAGRKGKGMTEQERLKEIQATIDSRAASVNEYDDTIVRQMIECIRVYHDGRLEIIFGGGYEIAEHL